MSALILYTACLVCLFVLLFAQVVMGLAYSILASALWPMVSLMIPEHQIGTAYGMYVMLHCLSTKLRTVAPLDEDQQQN